MHWYHYKGQVNFQSTNIDWLLFDNVSHTLYLVEFKTDLNSLDQDQYETYKEVRNRVNQLKDASFLYDDINNIKPRSNRQDKYQSLKDFIKSNSIEFSNYNKLKIIYFIPSDKKNFKLEEGDEFLFFYDLKDEIGLKEFQEEWLQLFSFLKTLSAKYDEK